jgi:hypothetical protein
LTFRNFARKMKFLATHFRKMLIDYEKPPENMLNYVMGKWYEFKVTGQKLRLLDLLGKVVSMSDRFPLLGKLLSNVALLLTCRASCERRFSVTNVLKN